jgi:hypothetical protein
MLLAALGGAESACASIAGLDGIVENACAPSCGTEEAGQQGPDGAGPEVSVDASIVAQESGLAEVNGDSASSEELQAPDGGEPESSLSEGGLDAQGADGGVAPTDAAPADAGPCGTVFFNDSFNDNAHSWTLDSSWSIAPTCSAPPAPAKGNPDPTVDHTTGAAGGVAGAYACGNNPTGSTAPAVYATSPTVNTSAAGTLFLTFYRWLNSDRSGYMTSTVDVYDGTRWVNLYSNPSTAIVSDSAWTRESYDVTMYKNASFRVRFGYAIVGASVYAMSCWNVDDVSISTVACP